MNASVSLRREGSIALFTLLLAASLGIAHARSSASRPILSPPAPDAPARIEVAFVLDTTGSMSGLIEGAKRKIWSIANQMASGQPTPEIRIGLIGYRDRGDAYVTRFYDLTQDVDGIYGHLSGFAADGGGDTPESVNQALHEAVSRMSWTESQDVYKVIFLVGDAPPHMDYQGDVPYVTSVRRARERGIAINTIQCGSIATTTPIWQEIAASGAGRYAAIRQDGGMVAIASPLDEELGRLNRELADTVIAWGAKKDREEIEATRRRALEAPASAAASRLGFLSKLGGYVTSGRADLVDAIEEGFADLSSLDAAELPEPMRAMSPAEREDYVEEKRVARNEIQRQIDELTAERDAWVEREQKRLAAAGDGDGFDQQVLEAIREQAAAKGISY